MAICREINLAEHFKKKEENSMTAEVRMENQMLKKQIYDLKAELFKAKQRAVSAEVTLDHVEECLKKGLIK